jgi:hypothetical protein
MFKLKILLSVFVLLLLLNDNTFAHQKSFGLKLFGSIIEANCSCGYTETMNLGGGKANYKTFCGFPYYCKDCKILFRFNYLTEEKNCPNCKSSNVIAYNDDSMREHISNKVVFGWNINDIKLELTDDNYLCPKCQKFTLKFSEIGNWD